MCSFLLFKTLKLHKINTKSYYNQKLIQRILEHKSTNKVISGIRIKSWKRKVICRKCISYIKRDNISYIKRDNCFSIIIAEVKWWLFIDTRWDWSSKYYRSWSLRLGMHHYYQFMIERKLNITIRDGYFNCSNYLYLSIIPPQNWVRVNDINFVSKIWEYAVM